MTTNILFNSIAPPVTVLIIDDETTPTAGQNYTLTCSVTGAENLNSTITYQWTKNDGTVIHTISNTLFFSTLRISNAGHYICKINISSDYLIQDIDASSNPFSVEFQGNLAF